MEDLGTGSAQGASQRPRPSRAGTALLAVVVVVATTALVVPAARAADAPSPATPARTPAAVDRTLAVVDQSLYVAAGGTFTMSVQLPATPEGAELFVEVYPQVPDGDRSAFARAAAGAFATATATVSPGPVIYPLDSPDYRPDAGGRLDLSIPTYTQRSDRRLGTVRLAVAGVYPVRVSLRDGDTNATLGQAVTFVVRLPEGPIEGELATALVVALDAPPATPPDPGAPVMLDPGAVAAWERTTDLLGARLDLPLTVAPRPETVAALGDPSADPEHQALVRRLAGAVVGRQVLAPPYVDVDAAGLVGAGLADELTDQVDRGEDALAGGLAPVRPDRRTWMGTADLDGATVERLQRLGVDQWLLPASALARPGDPGAAAAGRGLGRARAQVGTTTLEAVAVPDDALSAGLGAGGGRSAAMRLLAELAYLWFQAPSGGRGGRGVVLVTPSGWVPDPAMTGPFLDGLAASPLLEPVTIDGWFARVRSDDGAGGDAVRAYRSQPAPDLRGLADQLSSGHQQLSTLADFLPPGAGHAETDRLDRGLSVAASRALDSPRRQAYVAPITARVDQLKVAVPPLVPQTLTLTSRRGRVTVTLENQRPEPVNVLVALSSSKLSIAAPSRAVVLGPEAAVPVEFEVEARSTGAFGLTVEVRSPDGLILMRESRWTVRSTAVSGVGWFLSVGGLLFLAGWWGVQVRRDRRVRRAVRATTRAHHPSAPPAGSTVLDP